MSGDLLYQLSDELLDACAVILAADAPSRRFVSPGPPALDCCAQLTVHPGQMTKASSLDLGPLVQYTAVTGVSENTWPLVVTLTRCTANPDASGNPPSAAALDAVALLVLTDGWQLWNGVQQLIRDGNLFDTLGCKSTGIGPLTPLGEQGGCVGWTLSVPVVVPGEPPTPGLGGS